MSIADGDVKDALEAVGGTSIEQLLVLLGAVVLLTTVTQAFEFGSIRFLEGYWGTARLPQWVADLFAGRWERWEKEARGRREELQLEAFRSAERRYANAIDDIDVVRHVHADLLDVASVPKLSSDQEELLNELDWRDYASARTMRRLEAHEKRMNRFPRSSRIMPTRLGNLLRASEDRANEEIPGSVQGMVHRTYHLVPGHLQVEIDQFRNRLGLYASLVVTEFVVAVASAVLLFNTGLASAAFISASHLLLMALFYRATFGSAEAYGDLLETVAELVSTTVWDDGEAV
ncbi:MULTISPECIES: hypothetical protein [Candidatus Microthrix]|uniref:hypothetical protein n=1 Tax=Candidatus Neomicrothrix parvicella TaxID=41950 RepID=UPI0012FE44D6|nr:MULTISPECIES: hypothetical protein [Microthrix]MBK6502590.1 hypothetical protein [Candidatus Microthrix sp.]